MGRGLFLVVLVASLALPQAALGAIRCVPATGPGCDTGHATINAAVTASADDDTIRIAAGTYAEAVNTTKRLNFIGSGSGTLASEAGATVVKPGSGAAITLSRGGSVRSLRVVGSSGFTGQAALVFLPTVDGTYNYVVSDVVGIGGTGTDFIIGTGGSGLVAQSLSAARVMKLTVTGGAFVGGSTVGFSHGTALLVAGPGIDANLTGTSVVGEPGGGIALNVYGGGVFDATGLTAQGQTAAQVADATATFRRSRLEGVSGTVSAIAGLVVYDSSSATPTSVNVIDSLVTVTPSSPVNAAALSAATFVSGTPIAVAARGSTIVARGTDPQYAVVSRPSSGAPTATIDLRNTIARLEGPAEADEADVAADRGTVTAAYSDFATRLQLNGGTATEPGSATNLTADPLFDAGAFTLQSGSPLIDRGDPSVVTAGELDLAGNPRAAGLAPDIGAHEFQPPPLPPPPPPPPNAAPGLTKVSMTNKVFAPMGAQAARRRGKPVKRGTNFRYQLSEAATVTIAVERRARGRRAGKRCAKPTRKNRKHHGCKRWVKAGELTAVEQTGRQSTRFTGRLRKRALAPGRYRARIRAKDALGALSAERRLGFRVVRAR